MATYLIGDVHGHFLPLMRLLKIINFKHSKDILWFTGDLVNRGPENAEVLRWILAHKDNIVAVMGNHDAHLIACHRNIRKARKKDTFQDVLNAPDREILINWLIQRPLLHLQESYLLVHAGLLPDWTEKQALKLAKTLSKIIQNTNAVELLAEHHPFPMPKRWKDVANKRESLRLAFHAFINLRMFTAEGFLSAEKTAPDLAKKGSYPWFTRSSVSRTVLFGHWAALGVRISNSICALDSGAAWNGHLSALRLHDKAFFQVSTRAW